MTIDPTILPPRLGPDDPRGVLAFREPLPEPLQTREDSTQAHDFERAHAVGRRFSRPATATEIELLQALGFTDDRGEPPSTASTMTAVYVTGGVRTRSWPDLYEPTTPTESEPTP